MEHTAIHEAGHAVANHRRKIDQEKVSIKPDPSKDLLGRSVSAGVDHVYSEDDARSMALAYLAGYAALIAHGYSEDEALNGADDDYEKTVQLIETWKLDRLETLKREAIELMSQAENAKAVRLLADRLLENEEIYSDEIEIIIEVADGSETEENYQSFLETRRLARI